MNIKEAILLNTILGDALGSAYQGFSRNHILTSKNTGSGFPSIDLLIKKDKSKWRKTGLYSSISQSLILQELSFLRGRLDKRLFTKGLKFYRELTSENLSLFRHVDKLERNFLEREYGKGPGSNETGTSARVIAHILSFGLHNKISNTLNKECYQHILLYTSHVRTIVCTLIFSQFVTQTLSNANKLKPIKAVSYEIDTILTYIHNESAYIFNSGLNPDTFLKTLEEFKDLFHILSRCPDPDTAENEIIAYANKDLKSPVSRATVNYSHVLFPFAIYCAQYYLYHDNALSEICSYGGEAPALGALCGATIALYKGPEAINKELMDNLINKRHILEIISIGARDKGAPSLIEKFIKSELALTNKEHEEYTAQVKHLKINTEKKKKKRVTKEDLMSLPRPESWTKEDKAKWKKEKRKYDK